VLLSATGAGSAADEVHLVVDPVVGVGTRAGVEAASKDGRPRGAVLLHYVDRLQIWAVARDPRHVPDSLDTRDAVGAGGRRNHPLRVVTGVAAPGGGIAPSGHHPALDLLCPHRRVPGAVAVDGVGEAAVVVVVAARVQRCSGGGGGAALLGAVLSAAIAGGLRRRREVDRQRDGGIVGEAHLDVERPDRLRPLRADRDGDRAVLQLDAAPEHVVVKHLIADAYFENFAQPGASDVDGQLAF